MNRENKIKPSELNTDNKAQLARAISLIENQSPGFEDILLGLPEAKDCRIIGITGPPGAGKSTLTDALIERMLEENKKVAVICIDPSSPFNRGAILGDRIRMNRWYDHPNVFIRSMASRGALGGVAPMVIEVTEILKSAGFDNIIIETVGVGQSEVEIAGLADVKIVVLVPESGDEIQHMKSGLMEIADIFAVNKSDRPGADLFAANLSKVISSNFEDPHNAPQIIKTIASEKIGIGNLSDALKKLETTIRDSAKELSLATDRIYRILQNNRMKGCNKKIILEIIMQEKKPFNLYRISNKIENLIFK